MNDEDFIKQNLYLQALPVYEADIPYIHQILYTVNQAEKILHVYPNLNQKDPITIVDKELML